MNTILYSILTICIQFVTSQEIDKNLQSSFNDQECGSFIKPSLHYLRENGSKIITNV